MGWGSGGYGLFWSWCRGIGVVVVISEVEAAWL